MGKKEYEPSRDLMTSIDNQVSGSTLSKYGYTYDALGRRSDREQSGSAFTQTNTDTFAYNARSEVTGSSSDAFTADAHNPAYSYDPIGNRSGNTVDLNGTTDYTPNQLNQYSTVGAVNPIYDADGNRTSDGGTWTYIWNNENRLQQAKKHSEGGYTVYSFRYDYRGRLVQRSKSYVSTSGGFISMPLAPEMDVRYVYDGWNRIFSDDLADFGEDAQSTYLWGLDLSGSLQGAGGVGGLLKEGNLYPTYDANGNVMQKLDNVGNVVMNVAYDPFGNVISGTLTGEYGFSTKPFVDGPDWYYYGYRYYDPVMGRWPSRDPIGELGSVSWFERYEKVQTIKSSLGSALYMSSLGEYRRSIISFLFRPSESFSELNLYNAVSNNLVNGHDYLGQLSCFDLNSNFPNPTPECVSIDGFYRHCVNTCLLNRCTFGILGDGFADWVAGDHKKNDRNSQNDRWANDIGDAIGDSGGDCESSCASELKTEHAIECCQEPGKERYDKDDPFCCSDNN